MAEMGSMSVPVKLTTKLPMAWRHHCGTLNDSAWPSRDEESFCSGCRCDVWLEDVEARFLLVEVA